MAAPRRRPATAPLTARPPRPRRMATPARRGPARHSAAKRSLPVDPARTVIGSVIRSRGLPSNHCLAFWRWLVTPTLGDPMVSRTRRNEPSGTSPPSHPASDSSHASSARSSLPHADLTLAIAMLPRGLTAMLLCPVTARGHAGPCPCANCVAPFPPVVTTPSPQTEERAEPDRIRAWLESPGPNDGNRMSCSKRGILGQVRRQSERAVTPCLGGSPATLRAASRPEAAQSSKRRAWRRGGRTCLLGRLGQASTCANESVARIGRAYLDSGVGASRGPVKGRYDSDGCVAADGDDTPWERRRRIRDVLVYGIIRMAMPRYRLPPPARWQDEVADYPDDAYVEVVPSSALAIAASGSALARQPGSTTSVSRRRLDLGSA